MGFFRTLALTAVGYILFKSMKRAVAHLESQQVKAKVKEPSMKEMPRLKLDPITGVYVPEA